MADTTSLLNAPTVAGGDSMDESLVQQTSGASAKRPRVVLGNELGQLADATMIIDLLAASLVEQKRQTVLLQVLLTNLTGTNLTLDDIDGMRST